MSSCKKDPTGIGPIISFENQAGSDSIFIPAGVNKYTISGTITSDAGLKSVKYFLVVKQVQTQLEILSDFDINDSLLINYPLNDTFRISFPISNITENLKIAIVATDIDNISRTRYFYIIKTSSSFTFTRKEKFVNLSPGETDYILTGRIISDAGLNSVRCKSITDTSEIILEEIVDFPDPNTCNFSFSITGISHDMRILVSYSDKINRRDSLIFTINKLTGEINTWSVSLGAQNNIAGGFFSTADGQVFSLTEAATFPEKTDWFYYNNNGNIPMLVAPSDPIAPGIFSSISTWTRKNSTKFILTEITSAGFDSMTNDAFIIAPANKAILTVIESPEPGTVYAFAGTAGKKGLIKIGTITGGDSGLIEIIVKVQK